MYFIKILLSKRMCSLIYKKTHKNITLNLRRYTIHMYHINHARLRAVRPAHNIWPCLLVQKFKQHHIAYQTLCARSVGVHQPTPTDTWKYIYFCTIAYVFCPIWQSECECCAAVATETHLNHQIIGIYFPS